MSGDAPDQLPEEFSGFNLSVTFLHTGMPVLSKSIAQASTYVEEKRFYMNTTKKRSCSVHL